MQVSRTVRSNHAGWLGRSWVTGAVFMAGGAIVIAPFVGVVASVPLFLLFLHLPGTMMHQVDENVGDRFRTFVNGRLFGNRDVLTPFDILLINVPLAWGLNLAALYAALAGGPGYGLVAPYTLVLNALAHLAIAVRTRGYNPGLATAVLISLPLGIVTIVVIGRLETVDFPYQVVGFLIAALIHLIGALMLLYREERLRTGHAH